MSTTAQRTTRQEQVNILRYDSQVTTEQILAFLIAGRDKLDRAIEVLQGPMKRRGDHPKNSLSESVTHAIPLTLGTTVRHFDLRQPGRGNALAGRSQQMNRIE